MSMNLHFTIKKHHIPFPYQTSTTLTYAVMDAATREAQLALIKADCEEHDIMHCYEEVVDMMSDPDITLDYM